MQAHSTTFPAAPFPTWIALQLGAFRASLAARLRLWRERAEAHQAAQAFERLDDRLLRDLGFQRPHAASSREDRDWRRAALYQAF